MSDQQVTHCPDCHEQLINVTSGSVCPKGHGGLYPRLSASTLAKLARARERATLPKAECVGLKQEGTTLFRIEGKPGYWQSVPYGDGERAVVNDRIRHFDPIQLYVAAKKWLKE